MSNEIVPSFQDLAEAVLNPDEQNELSLYISGGGRPLSIETAAKFFELYLAGNTIDDICAINKAFPRAAINWCRVKYGWDQRKDECVSALQQKACEKVLRAQMETSALVSDLLIAASIKHGDAIKKFIMTRDSRDLPKGLDLDSVTNLLRLSEGLIKLTGQDRVVKVQGGTNNTQTIVNKNETVIEVKTPDGMAPETAAKILELVAQEKRSGKK